LDAWGPAVVDAGGVAGAAFLSAGAEAPGAGWEAGGAADPGAEATAPVFGLAPVAPGAGEPVEDPAAAEPDGDAAAALPAAAPAGAVPDGFALALPDEVPPAAGLPDAGEPADEPEGGWVFEASAPGWEGAAAAGVPGAFVSAGVDAPEASLRVPPRLQDAPSTQSPATATEVKRTRYLDRIMSTSPLIRGVDCINRPFDFPSSTFAFFAALRGVAFKPTAAGLFAW